MGGGGGGVGGCNGGERGRREVGEWVSGIVIQTDLF